LFGVSVSVSLFIIIFIRNEAGSSVGSGGFHRAHPVSLFIIIFIRNEAGSSVGSGGFHGAHPGSNPSVVLHKKTPHLFLPNHRSN
jgi:hypothetical protein